MFEHTLHKSVYTGVCLCVGVLKKFMRKNLDVKRKREKKQCFTILNRSGELAIITIYTMHVLLMRLENLAMVLKLV